MNLTCGSHEVFGIFANGIQLREHDLNRIKPLSLQKLSNLLQILNQKCMHPAVESFSKFIPFRSSTA